MNKAKLYKDGSLKLTNNITLRLPTIGEIIDCGEDKYFSAVSILCSNGFDYKWQLDDIGIDFTQVDDYELFVSMIAPSLTNEDTRLILGDKLSFDKMQQIKDSKTGLIQLVQKVSTDEYFIFDKSTYVSMVDCLRCVHGLERNFEVYYNESTRKAKIEDARLEYEIMQMEGRNNKENLFNLVSAMVNNDNFPRNDKNVWEMNIYAFMDSVKRIQKTTNANLLLQSGYSGFGVNLKEIDKSELDWLGEV